MTESLRAEPLARGLGWTIAPVIIFAAMAALFAFALHSGDPSKLPSALIGKPVPRRRSRRSKVCSSTAPLCPASPAPISPRARSRSSISGPRGACRASRSIRCSSVEEQTGVDLYGVNYKDDPNAARRFLGPHGNPFTRPGTDPQGRGAIEWGVYGMPETFVINGKGEIAYKHVGPLSESSLVEQVIPAIEAARRVQ